MAFNELNTVEHYIIHQLSGVKLNTQVVAEPKGDYGPQWQFKSAQELNRTVNEVLDETALKSALIRLNPNIAANENLADELVYKLRAILISVNQIGFSGYMVQTWPFRKQVMTIAQGTKVLCLATSRMAKLKITIPCLDEQKKTVENLSQFIVRLIQ